MFRSRVARVSLLSRDAGTETFEDGFIHPYAYEWGDRRPWHLEPEMEPCPHAVPPCLLYLIHTHAPVRLSDAETQTPDAAHITIQVRATDDFASLVGGREAAC